MKFKTKLFIFPLFIALSVLFFTGCSLFTTKNSSDQQTLNEMDYFNKFVDELNKTSDSLKVVHQNYEDSVPLDVSVDDNISLDITNKPEIDQKVNDLEKNLLQSNLKIADSTKQTTLENLLKEYIAQYRSFLSLYEEIGNYYANGTYKTDITKAAAYEKDFQDRYSAARTKEQAVYDQLDAYQSTSVYKARLSSDDPLERLNATIDLLTNEAEALYNEYMDEWDVASAPTSLENKFAQLKTDKEQSVTSLNTMDFSDPSSTPVKSYFDNTYMTYLDSLMNNFQKLFDDYKAGSVSMDTIANYDSVIQSDYEKIISSHNEIINLTEKSLGQE